MLRCVDTVRAVAPLYHLTVANTATRTLTRTTGCGEVSISARSQAAKIVLDNCTVNRWITSRFNVLSSLVIGCVAFIAVFSFMDAAIAGFALTFATTITSDLLFMVRRFVGLEQAMVRHPNAMRLVPLPTHDSEGRR